MWVVSFDLAKATLITKTYNGMSFVFREDGWFNVTQAAKHFGKQLQHFWSAPGTLEYRAALQEMRAKASDSDEFPQDHETKRGRYGSTWAHPNLTIRFAQWLDPRFAVWCDMMVEDILTKKAEVTIVKPQESAVRTAIESRLEG